MITGLALAADGLDELAEKATSEIEEQLEGNDEFTTVVAALEHQYDQVHSADNEAAFTEPENVPTGDELAAQFESFLRDLDAEDGSPQG